MHTVGGCGLYWWLFYLAVKNELGGATPETNEIVTLICSCHNFFSFLLCKYVLYQLVAYCVCFKMIYKKSI